VWRGGVEGHLLVRPPLRKGVVKRLEYTVERRRILAALRYLLDVGNQVG
jgi:hypothetical protein